MRAAPCLAPTRLVMTSHRTRSITPSQDTLFPSRSSRPETAAAGDGERAASGHRPRATRQGISNAPWQPREVHVYGIRRAGQCSDYGMYSSPGTATPQFLF
ncbi:hypothetical protein QQF64_023479 [Cirrhinus molitorella]|uniref:Uncharacterized protein n=1 Tax=Cirrhinus molitorella TaxID=172907 RepID=A0ABR3L986_9TELE